MFIYLVCALKVTKHIHITDKAVLLGQHNSADKDASAIRANYPMPRPCGVYYFEIEILNRGQKGYALLFQPLR